MKTRMIIPATMRIGPIRTPNSGTVYPLSDGTVTVNNGDVAYMESLGCVVSGSVGKSAVRTVSGTTDMILTTDNGNAVRYTSGSGVAITVPPGLGVGFSCLSIQMGAGQLTFAAGDGATLNNRQSQLKSAGQYAECSLFCDVDDDYVLAGDTSA